MALKLIAYVQASWHTEITDHCRTAFMAEMARHGYETGDVEFFSVPGSLNYAAVCASGLVVDGGPYPASAQAAEATVVLKIPADPVIALAERHPSFIKEMALMIGRRLRAAHDSVASLAVDPVEARLAAALLRLAKREGTRGDKGVTLPFHLTRQSLADMTGTTVETAIRILSRWIRDGVLDDDGGRLVLTDWEGLSELAEGEAD